MLKKEQITNIAKLLRLDEASLVAAMTSTDEVEVSIPEVSVFTAEEITKRDESVKSAGYKEGKGAAVEMLVKEYREKLDLKFEGKDPEKLVEAIREKTLADAKVEPNKKIEELNGVIAKLQDNVKTFEAEKQTLVSQINASKTDSKLLSLFPANRNPLLKDEEYLNMIKNEYTFAEEDGKTVVKKSGEIVRDSKTQTPLEPKDVITGYFTERKWTDEGVEGRQGRGGAGDTGKPGIHLKLSQLASDWEKSGKSTQGVEFQSAVEAARQANPNFDMNS